MYRGLQPHGSLRSSAVVILGVIQVLSFFGYLGGFFDRTDQLEWHEFEWDPSTRISTMTLCLAWGISVYVLLKAKVDQNTKLGGMVLVSLPMAIFVLLFFELVTLGPR